MELSELRSLIAGTEFEPSIRAAIFSVLDAAHERGHMTEDERVQLLKLADIQTEMAAIEADAAETMARALKQSVNEFNTVVQTAAHELEAVAKEAETSR